MKIRQYAFYVQLLALVYVTFVGIASNLFPFSIFTPEKANINASPGIVLIILGAFIRVIKSKKKKS